MQAVDVTEMSEKEREKVGTEPIDAVMGDDGVIVPKKTAKARVIRAKQTGRNKKLVKKYGIKILDRYGLINYTYYPPDDLLDEIIRDVPHRQDIIESAGPKKIALLLKKFIPQNRSTKKGEVKELFENFLRPKPVRKPRNPNAAKKTTKPKKKVAKPKEKVVE